MKKFIFYFSTILCCGNGVKADISSVADGSMSRDVVIAAKVLPEILGGVLASYDKSAVTTGIESCNNLGMNYKDAQRHHINTTPQYANDKYICSWKFDAGSCQDVTPQKTLNTPTVLTSSSAAESYCDSACKTLANQRKQPFQYWGVYTTPNIALDGYSADYAQGGAVISSGQVLHLDINKTHPKVLSGPNENTCKCCLSMNPTTFSSV